MQALASLCNHEHWRGRLIVCSDVRGEPVLGALPHRAICYSSNPLYFGA